MKERCLKCHDNFVSKRNLAKAFRAEILSVLTQISCSDFLFNNKLLSLMIKI